MQLSEISIEAVQALRIGTVDLSCMKKIGFLSFGHWAPSPQSGTQSAADAVASKMGARTAPLVEFNAELAVADVVKSAFGHAGQKCSAASLVILVGSVATSERFKRQLVDSVSDDTRKGYLALVAG